MNTSDATLWISLELDPGTAAFFGLHPRLYLPADAQSTFDGAGLPWLTLTGLGRALERAAEANPEMSGRADVLRFLNRWPRYADLERYLRVDNATFARTVAQGLLENDPRDPPAQSALALLAARQGRWSEARDRLERALETAPTHALTRLHRALARAAARETDAALEELRELERRPRVQTLARFWRYEVERGASPDRLSGTIGLVHGLQDREGVSEAWEELARAHPDNPEVLYTEGVRAEPALADHERRDRLARALAADAEHVPARDALATLRLGAGQAEEALALVEAAPRGDREHPLLTAARGRILEQMGRDGEARRTYLGVLDQPLALLPHEALEAAGRGLVRLDEPAATRRRLEEAARARPGDPLPARLLATLDERIDGRAAAERRLRAAVRVCGPVPDLQYALGDLLRRSGRTVEAEGLFKVLARRHPRSPWGHRGLGDLAVRERPAEAVDHYARALALDPWTPLPGHDYLRGVAALRAGDPASARSWFERSVAAEPDNARTWCDLGAARFHAGDLEGALAATRRALALEPGHPGFLHNLAVYHDERFRRNPFGAWRSWWTARRLHRRSARAAGSGAKQIRWRGPGAPAEGDRPDDGPGGVKGEPPPAG